MQLIDRLLRVVRHVVQLETVEQFDREMVDYSVRIVVKYILLKVWNGRKKERNKERKKEQQLPFYFSFIFL
jgi:hypothetical protein